MSDLVGNPVDRFSHEAAPISPYIKNFKILNPSRSQALKGLCICFSPSESDLVVNHGQFFLWIRLTRVAKYFILIIFDFAKSSCFYM